MNRLTQFCLGPVAALAAACHLTMPAPSVGAPSFPASPGELRVGTGRADITPPPGVATFGHGPDARVTNGVWTRLYCRVFVFVSGSAELAIVPCDLPAVSTLLERRVARELERRRVPIPASRLMMVATHTHAGPAHYFDGRAYSGLGSTQLPGYDDRMVTFLSERIADAVRDAASVGRLRPVNVRWVRDRVFGLTRNRDLAAFLRNQDPPWPPGCPPELEAAFCAIDPELSILQIVDAANDQCELGSLTFFAMHPTVLPNTNRLLGADAFGVTSRALESGLRAHNAKSSGCDPDPLAAVVPTNSGDQVPRWSSGSVQEAIQVGLALADHVKAAAHEADQEGRPFTERPIIAARYVEFDFSDNSFEMPGTPTCPEAEFGLRGAFGASDHPTFLDVGAMGAHDPDFSRDDCQWPKRAFPWFVQRSARGPKSYTSTVPMAVARIDDELINFVPAELTFATGHRLDARVLERYGSEPGRPALHATVAGPANGYIQYITTEEEYAYQGYEGASTLFGSRSARLVANVASALAQSLRDPTTVLPARADAVRPFEYWLGPERERLPRGQGEATLAELGGQRGPRRICSVPTARPPAVCFAWTDGAPGVVPITSGPWIGITADKAPNPEPSLPEWQPASSPLRDREILLLDDRGIGFRTSVHSRVGDAWLWTTLVQPLASDWESLRPWGALRIGADIQTAAPIRSDSFSEDALPPPCSVEMQRLCGI
jgi:neutral ceramidase